MFSPPEEENLISAPASGAALEGLSVRISREQEDSDWDRFVEGCPNGYYTQSSLWGRVKACYGWQPTRVVVRGGTEIVGGVQILARRFGRMGQIALVSRGPVVTPGIPGLGGFVIEQLDRVAAAERLTYLALVPPYHSGDLEKSLPRTGFRRKPNHLPPSGEMTATLLLDLSPDFDTLLSRMRKTTRNNIRHATREGVVRFREGGAEDVETFRRLMWALCKRRGVSPSPPQKDFFANLWRIFRPSGSVRLFVVELDGRTIVAAILFSFGDTVRIWKIGWEGDHAKRFPNEMLYWEAIRWAKVNGYRYFDFVQIDRALALALQRGDNVDWTTVCRRSNFKIGFGGEPLVLPEAWYRTYHPVLHMFARTGGNRLIESPAFAKFGKRFWGRFEGS